MKYTPVIALLASFYLAACGSPRASGGTSTPTDAGSASDTPTVADDASTPTDVPATTKDVGETLTDVPVAIDAGEMDVNVTPMPVCGDDECNGGETCESCRADCAATCPPPPVDVPMPRCGDGTCDEGESCESCRADCAAMCPPPPVDVPMPRCGDGTCAAPETCGNCPTDCGACPVTGAQTDPCGPGVPQGPGRNCGWVVSVTLTCSPGRATMVGCSGSEGAGSLCQPSYGVCTGDPAMRVCPGTTPCTAAQALAVLSGSFDDQCGTCPSAYVTCPSSGQIHVLTGDYDSNQPTQRGTCTPAAR